MDRNSFVFKFFTLSFVTFLISAPIAAGTENEKEQLIMEWVELTGATKQHDQMLLIIRAQLKAEGEKMVTEIPNIFGKEYPNRLDEIKKIFIESNQRWIQTFDIEIKKEINYDTLTKYITVPLYSKHFSVDELKELVAFYKTPLGQKLKDMSPKLMEENSLAFNQRFGPKIDRIIQEVTAKERINQQRAIEKFRKQ